MALTNAEINFILGGMNSDPLRARESLRAWRRNQSPRMSQRALGAKLGKTGALVGMFENGRSTLTLGDCVRLQLITGIPLEHFLLPGKIRQIAEAARLLGLVA